MVACAIDGSRLLSDAAHALGVPWPILDWVTAQGKGRPMQRTLVLSVAASALVSVLLTLLVMTLALPAIVDAQANRLQAERVSVVGPNGMDRVVLGTGPGAH